MAQESSQLRQETRIGLQSDKLEFASASASLRMKESMSVSDKVETTDDTLMTLANASGDITTEGQFTPSEADCNWVASRTKTTASCPEDVVLSAIYGLDSTTSNVLAYSPSVLDPKLFSTQIVSPKKLQVCLGTVFSGEEFEAGSSQGLVEHKTKMMYSRALDLEHSKVLSVSESGGVTSVTLESATFADQLNVFEPFNGSNAMKYNFLKSNSSTATTALSDFDVEKTSSDPTVVTSASYEVGSAVVKLFGDFTGSGSDKIEAGDYFAPQDQAGTLISSDSYFQDNHSNLELRLNLRADGTAVSQADLLASDDYLVPYFEKFSYNFSNNIEFRGGFVSSSKTLDPFYTDSSNMVEGEIMMPLIASNSSFKGLASTYNAMDILMTMQTGSDLLRYYIPDAHRKEVSSEIGSAFDSITIPWKGQGVANTALCTVTKS